MIELSGVTKRFGTKCAVDRLDLEVRPGELFAFLGPNGAGKTTTIKMICGLLAPNSRHGAGRRLRRVEPAGAAIARATYPTSLTSTTSSPGASSSSSWSRCTDSIDSSRGSAD